MRETDHPLAQQRIEIVPADPVLTDGAPEASPDKIGVDGIRDEFMSLATTYEILRGQLREVEKRIIGLRDITSDKGLLEGLEDNRRKILTAIHENREHFLPVIYALETAVGMERAFDLLHKWIAKVGGAGKYLEDWTGFGKQITEHAIYSLYMSSVSLLEEEGPRRTPSPYESILATIDTRKLAREINSTIQADAVSVAQTGSGSWGAFFGLRGQSRQDPIMLDEYEMRDLKMISDLDMIVVVETPENIVAAVRKLVERGMLNTSDLTRAKRFAELYDSGRADIFSVRGKYHNIEQSYHFLPRTVVEQITDEREISDEVPVVHDYRPDFPGSFKKYGGYPILGVEGKEIALLKKDPVPVDMGNPDLGYISDSPAGGPVRMEDGSTQFALGILSTQLLYQPDIMHDTDGFLRIQVEKFLSTVAKYLPHESGFRVPRWERMPVSFRRKLMQRLYERSNKLAKAAELRGDTAE